MLFRSLILAGALLSTTGAYALPRQSLQWVNATIASTSGVWRVDAGIIATWIRFDVRQGERRRTVYALQFTHDEPVPAIGAVCSFDVRRDRISAGSLADGAAIPDAEINVASRIVCVGQDFLAHG
jgi:hypothetical protein